MGCSSNLAASQRRHAVSPWVWSGLLTLMGERRAQPPSRRTCTWCTAERMRRRMAWRAAEQLRDAGLSVVFHCGGGSFKSQMKKADASRARFRRHRRRRRGGDAARGASSRCASRPLSSRFEMKDAIGLIRDGRVAADIERDNHNNGNYYVRSGRTGADRRARRRGGSSTAGSVIVLVAAVSGACRHRRLAVVQAQPVGAGVAAATARSRKAMRANDLKQIRELSGQLMDKFGGTAYGPMAALGGGQGQLRCAAMPKTRAGAAAMDDRQRSRDDD